MNTPTPQVAIHRTDLHGRVQERVQLSVQGSWLANITPDGVVLMMDDPVGLAEALADALTPEQRACLVAYLTTQSTDWCTRCEKKTRWAGETCTACGRLWGHP